MVKSGRDTGEEEGGGDEGGGGGGGWWWWGGGLSGAIHLSSLMRSES